MAKAKNDTETPAAWLANVVGLLDDFHGGTLRKLEVATANTPVGPEVFVAPDGLLDRYESRHVLDPVGKVARDGGNRLGDVARQLLAAADRALGAGLNSSSDPVVRPKDFGETAGVWAVTPYETAMSVGDPTALPAGHPFRDVEPLVDANGRRPLIVLGRAGAGYYRLSVVRALTARAVTHRREQDAERPRVEELERQRLAERERNSPAGMLARIKELEQQLAAAKKGELVGV